MVERERERDREGGEGRGGEGRGGEGRGGEGRGGEGRGGEGRGGEGRERERERETGRESVCCTCMSTTKDRREMAPSLRCQDHSSTKVCGITRALRKIRQEEPEAKILVFSSVSQCGHVTVI